MSSELLENDGPDQPLPGSRLVPMIASGRILVPIDFSACSLAALEHALAMAERFGSSVDVLHVWSLPRTLGPDDAVALPGHRHETVAAFADTQAAQVLEQMMIDLAGRSTVEVRSRVEGGDPGAEIIRIAEQDGYDLIVMGTHGGSRLSHILRGNVAEKVIRRAPCPVLTIRVVNEDALEGRETIELAETEIP